VAKKSHLLLALIALVSLSFTVFLGKANDNLLRGVDSNIHAKASLSVTRDGFSPKLPILGINSKDPKENFVFNDHPFFLFWANGHLMRALGPSAWSARILTAGFSVGCVILVFALGSLLASSLHGFLAAVMFLFTRDIILTGATVSLDPAMMFFILLSFFFWIKKQWIPMALATGFGLWIKTPVVLLVYPTAVIFYGLNRNLRPHLKPLFLTGALTVLIGSSIWIITGYIGGWSWVRDYWVRQVWGTAVLGRGNSTWSDLSMPFHLIRSGFIPWLPFIFLGILNIYRKKRWSAELVQISLIACGVTIFFVSLVKSRMPYYYNPIFPFLTLLSAYSLESLKKFERKIYLGFTAITLPLLALVVCTPISFGSETFVALKRFIPFIQTYSDCDDRILLISGGEPVGGAMSYQLVLNFYADRIVDTQNCASVPASLKKHFYHWIVVSNDNLECLPKDTISNLPTQIRVGSQYLLTDKMQKMTTIDLTPLERELKPTVDCNSPPYPRDIYHKY
jgi:hypothetical protein